MVGLQNLDLPIGVRVPVSQPNFHATLLRREAEFATFCLPYRTYLTLFPANGENDTAKCDT